MCDECSRVLAERKAFTSLSSSAEAVFTSSYRALVEPSPKFLLEPNGTDFEHHHFVTTLFRSLTPCYITRTHKSRDTTTMTVIQGAKKSAIGGDSLTACSEPTSAIAAETYPPTWSGLVIASADDSQQANTQIPLLTDCYECTNCPASDIIEVPDKSYMMCASCGTSTGIDFRIPTTSTTSHIQNNTNTNTNTNNPPTTAEDAHKQPPIVEATTTPLFPGSSTKTKTLTLEEWSTQLRSLDAKTPAYLRDWIKSCPRCGVSFSLCFGRLVMDCRGCGFVFCWMCFVDYTRVWADGEHVHCGICPLWRPSS
jgi:hypothetical protein